MKSLLARSNSTFQINLPTWSGPFDLLLDLIKTSKLDINEISLEKITNQYLTTIKALEKLNIELTADFLVVTSTLILIKSRKLLPHEKIEIEEISNLKKKLVVDLLNYEKFKQASQQLLELENQEYLMKTAKPLSKKTLTPSHSNSQWQRVELKELVISMAKLLDFKKKINNLKKIKFISIEEKISVITQKLKEQEFLCFSKILNFNHPQEIVAFFWAILELYKNTQIVLKQKKNFSEIYIIRINN